MSWSWRIGRIAGIDVYIHFTFLLLLAWIFMAYYLANRSVAEALYGLGFIIALFAVVVLHELGHALAARHYGIRTRDITLLPIGGVARLERMPDDPKQELIVALAGPAVNVVIAAGLYVGLLLGHGLAPVADTLSVGGNFLNQMLVVNVSLAVFNLLPAFPMDGFCLLRDMDQHAPCMGKARQPGSAFRAEDDHVVPMTWLRLPVHVLGQIPGGCRRLHGEIRAAADRA